MATATDSVVEIVLHSELSVATVDLATRRIHAVSDAIVAVMAGQREALEGHVVTDFLADEPTGALPLIASGKLEGYEAVQQIRRCDGEVIRAHVWAHVLGDERPARYGALFVTTDPRVELVAAAASSKDRKVIGTVDDEWRVDRISQDVELVLGYAARELRGVPLLTGVHPGDLPNLLTGLAHVHATSRDALVRIRVRHRRGSWLTCRCRLGALGQGPSFAFTLRRVVESLQSPAERARELEGRLARIAREVHASSLPVTRTGAPVVGDLPELAELTSREWEVLSRLADGHRVPRIATDLALSPSTVRNHLSSIFGKLGVGSQSELLDRLRPGTQAPTG